MLRPLTLAFSQSTSLPIQLLDFQACVTNFQELAIVIGTAVGSIVVALGIVALVIGIYILIEFFRKKD